MTQPPEFEPTGKPNGDSSTGRPSTDRHDDASNDARDEILFLLSRSFDETLTTAEHNRLEVALASNDSLGREARSLQRVHALVNQWATGHAEVDSSEFRGSVQTLIDQDDKNAQHRLGKALEEWRQDVPEVDPREFRMRVVGELVAESSQNRWVRRFTRVVPMAAAAAIVLAATVLTYFRIRPERTATSVVSFEKAALPHLARESTPSDVNPSHAVTAPATAVITFEEQVPPDRPDSVPTSVAIVTISTPADGDVAWSPIRQRGM